MSEDKKPLTPHPIVAKLAADPAAPLDTAQFVGYVGKSTRPEHHRLYRSLQLDEYIDIPFAAVVHHEDIPDTEMEHGGTRVWVDAGATVIHETRQTTRTEARFLEGSIADEYLQDTTADPSQFARPYTPYCRTNEGACTAYSCGTCVHCPGGGGDDQQFGTPPPPTRIVSCFTCVWTCVATCRTCVTCQGTCQATCQASCRATCVTCVASCRIVTCGRTCTPRCEVTRPAVCVRTPVCPVRTPACPGGTAICPVTPGCPLGTDGPVETSGPGPVEQPAFGAGYDQGYGYHNPYGGPGAWYGYGGVYPPWRR